MSQMYDWSLTNKDGVAFKFFHSENQYSVDEMWRVIRATELPQHPNAACLHLTGNDAQYATTIIRDRQYHLVPFTDIDHIWFVERTKVAERLNLYDAIKGECGED